MDLSRPPSVAIIDHDSASTLTLTKLFDAYGWQHHAFKTCSDFLEQAHASTFNCLILETALPDMSGVELFEKLILAAQTSTSYLPPVLFFTGFGTIRTAVSVMKQGACDFLEKPLSRYRLLNALEHALNVDGERRPVFSGIAPRLREFATLTERERQILSEIMAGYLSKQIAERLQISPKTVEAHRLRICQKFHARTSMELAAKLRRLAHTWWPSQVK